MARWSLEREVRRLPDVEVAVVGGGCAGTVAAVSAARCGADVLLIERDATLGGTSTAVLDTFYGFYVPRTDDRRVVAGVPGEVASRLVAGGAAFLRPNTYGAGTGVTYNPETLRIPRDSLCDQAGVRVLLGASLVDVAGEAGRPAELLLVSGSELFSVRAANFVDASGDACSRRWPEPPPRPTPTSPTRRASPPPSRWRRSTATPSPSSAAMACWR